ncbi:MAG: TenA family protein [Chloroflexi bacterium]|nr:TenA family protein [Chloroflexota bacterium]
MSRTHWRRSLTVSNPPLSKRLWDDNRDLAEACLEHPFIVGLADGTLSESRYGLFAQQDHFYLDAYARSYAWGAVRAQDFATRRQFGSLLAGIMTEGTLHEKTAPELGVSLEDVQPLPAAREYTDFLLATASLGTIGEHIAAMAPCAKLYGWLGTRLADQPYEERYAFWINMYAGAGYLEKVDIIMGMLDEHGEDSATEAIRFRTAMELEYHFFDSAWVNGESG